MMNKLKWYGGFIAIISNGFILLFVYAATSKLLLHDKFVLQIGQSPMLSAYAGLLAWMVPVLELLLALMLVFERLRLVGLYGSLSLMVAFTAYIYIILNYTENIPCSCGGVLEKLGWPEHLVFNIGFVVLAIIAITLSNKNILLRNESGLTPKTLQKKTSRH
ncbi:putative membrane protein YphA (DoxX/SURF4 family) [Pedobacter africanus]|uniref:Membrane protein YphA (DoxX/SURF4 family) n=1 Tax=Pedobacter africanus TaxID=151894 RepID=A0ACC6L2Z3_9SPHI|nr:MauE/DoxX family redox-associated membrane protein [Pedobacter africanus]MDR6785716.1 putative membrane protein YphA (DoxX/SURF4 family) [Pedobacter africanus]